MEVDVSEMVLELAVGDVLQIGDRLLTVIAVETTEVTFRIEEGASESVGKLSCPSNEFTETSIPVSLFPNRPR